jgi:hypothetical protein
MIKETNFKNHKPHKSLIKEYFAEEVWNELSEDTSEGTNLY